MKKLLSMLCFGLCLAIFGCGGGSAPGENGGNERIPYSYEEIYESLFRHIKKLQKETKEFGDPDLIAVVDEFYNDAKENLPDQRQSSIINIENDRFTPYWDRYYELLEELREAQREQERAEKAAHRAEQEEMTQ